MKNSISPGSIGDYLERVLLRVQKPGRYVGGELNEVIKNWEDVETHVALVFPDIYDIGLSNLGLAILYDIINNRSDTYAERAYCPWVDMEEILRKDDIPLFSLETKHPLTDFDILAITLPYETLYTNTINLLDLAKISIRSANRRSHHPLVIAGGHAAYNPEPMSDFIDAFVIGEGEEIIHEIIDTYQKWKKSQKERSQLLINLSQIWGVYVPSLYAIDYNKDGTIFVINKLNNATNLPVLKRIVAQLPAPPSRLIVPSIDVVHNRIPVEIMRGCTRGCRFCHAGMVSRPVRERPVDEIIKTIREGLNSTGYEEVALLSLSSSDYSYISELVETICREFDQAHLTISLPSLRIESFSVELLDKLKGSRQGGFTLAPEAATERMQNLINKPIPVQKLLDTVGAIYSRGWTTIKLYFMIGHPSETLDDVKEIANLCKQIIAIGHQIIGKKANLRAGVSTFVPKPHTPFQWVPCDTLEQIEAKQKILKNELKGPGLKLNWTDPKETMLEAWLTRGDRRMSEVIYQAWLHGARFDAWQDQINIRAWQEAFINTGLDPNFYTHRTRHLDEILPWDHISTGITKKFLKQEYMLSLDGICMEDCRNKCHACGILTAFNHLRSQNSVCNWKCPQIDPIINSMSEMEIDR